MKDQNHTHLVTNIKFKQILPFWKILWPHMNVVPEISPIKYMGGIDLSLQKNRVVFLAYKTDKVLGVNSVSKTNKIMYRSRGLWVYRKARRKGIGRALLQKSEEIAKEDGAKFLWSMPRHDSLNFYKRCGFEQRSGWFNKYEFGPHCFVVKRL